jgi:hypothetical protein
VTVLPPGCTSGCAVASNDGSYPGVWNNDSVDGTFGVTSPILLDQITQSGRLVNTLQVPVLSGSGSGHPRDGSRDHMVTSFSSKSELALNLSTSGRDLTFMGYLAQPNALDVSNSNTPGVIDPTNPVPGANYHVVGQVDPQGRFHFTETNAYSGDNGRAAIVNDSGGGNVYYMAGNAGNGSNPQPDGIIIGAGAQIATPRDLPESEQQVDKPAATAPARGESFRTVRSAGSREVLRGVSFTPGTGGSGR